MKVEELKPNTYIHHCKIWENHHTREVRKLNEAHNKLVDYVFELEQKIKELENEQSNSNR